MMYVLRQIDITVSFFVLALNTFSYVTPHALDDPFVISIATNGTYSVQIQNVTWLQSAPIFFNVNGKMFTTEDASLKLNGTVVTMGTDSFGQWQAECYPMVAEMSSISGCFKTYNSPSLPIVIFQQIYHNGAAGVSLFDANKTVSGFPSFIIPEAGPSLGYLSYGGIMAGDDKTYGVFTSGKAELKSGLVSGPLVLFDRDDNVLVISPFSQFMAGSMYQDRKRKRISWGILGSVSNVPVNFIYETIIYYGGNGINQAMSDWGALMRAYYGKESAYRESDFTLNYLGYWTDGGAYYYYNTVEGKNYEDTILDIHHYANKSGIPYRYIQYDSFFYPKGKHNGTMTWDALTSLFPHGFQYLYDKTGLPPAAHNRYWSNKTPYAKKNGGQFDFIVEDQNYKAIPVDQNFWDYLFRTSREWGLVMYEQDWLNVEFRELNVTLSDISLGRTWLRQMGKGAQKNDVTIQYCMSNPRHVLQSLEIPVVTQVRVSSDYRAGSDNWKIGVTSIFVDAVGLAPFKDTFWSTEFQPGNPQYPDLIEPHSELQVIVSTLSTGPVGPGDVINGSDVKLIMTCCNSDGLILKPTKPATAVDAQIQQQAFQDGSGPEGEVWSTFSKIGSFTFGIIMASAMTSDYTLSPKGAGFDSFNPTVVFPRAYKHHTTVSKFGAGNPLKISRNCDRDKPCLFYTSPVFTHGDRHVLIYGEEDKVVPMSPKRVVGIDSSDDIQVTVRGVHGETITFVFLASEAFIRVKCTVGSSGTAVISLIKKNCTSF